MTRHFNPSDWIAIAAIGATVVLGLFAPFINDRLHQRHWRRDRRADAYQRLIAVHMERLRWRESLGHDFLEFDLEPLPEAIVGFFGREDIFKLALLAYNAHLEYAKSVNANKDDIAAGRIPLTVSADELARQQKEAGDAERKFSDAARRDCGLDA